MNYKSNVKFDFIFSIRAFEYIEDKEKFINKCFNMLNHGGKILIITKTKCSYWYGKSKIRKLLRKILPFLFYYENQALREKNIDNTVNFWQERICVKKFTYYLNKEGFSNFSVKPVIIRPPIFMRGKSEIPLVPPFLEKPLLALLKPINKIFSNCPFFTIFAESYLITGIKK